MPKPTSTITATTTTTTRLTQLTLHESLMRSRSSSLGQIPNQQKTNWDGNNDQQNRDTQKKVDWQKIPMLRQHKRKRMQSKSPTSKTSTANKFADLPLDDDGDNATFKAVNKPPPILLYGIEDITKLTTLLNTVVSAGDYKYKIVTSQQLRISSTCVEKYKKIIELIREQGLIGHTFTRKDDRPYGVVIKHLHFTTPIKVIKEAIELTGNKIRGKIINARFGPSKKPLNTFFVNMEPGPNNKLVKDIMYIFNMRVSIEDPKKKKTIVQCQRCQQYGHTKNNCLRPYRCVKCAEAHKTTDYPKKDRNTPAKCALCLGSHPANYKGCEVYREIEKRRTPTINRKPKEINQKPPQNAKEKNEAIAWIPQSTPPNTHTYLTH